MNIVEERFNKNKTHYKRIKQEAESKVSEWYWATNQISVSEPFYFEIGRYSRGRKLKSEPANKNSKYQIGLDELGRVIIEKQYVSFENQYYETFYRYSENEIESVHYDYSPKKELVYTHIYIFEQKKLSTIQKWAKFGSTKLDYIYENDKIINIESLHTDFRSSTETFQLYKLTYDDFGKIYEIIGDNDKIVFKKKNVNHNFKYLSEIVIDKMPNIIADKIMSEKLEKEVYCVVLLYGYQESFPPNIGIGYEKERDTFLKEKKEDAKWYIWNPAEYKEPMISIEGLDEEFDNVCKALNQIVEFEEKENKIVDVLTKVCKKIYSSEDFKQLKKTEDFIIYPVHYELNDFNKNIKKIYGANFLKSLKDKKLSL